MKKNTTWNLKRLVADSFIPSTHRTRVSYSRLTDFKSEGKEWFQKIFPNNATVEGKFWLYFLSIFLLVVEFGRFRIMAKSYILQKTLFTDSVQNSLLIIFDLQGYGSCWRPKHYIKHTLWHSV